MKDVLVFLAKFLALSAVLFVAFTAAQERYYTVLARTTAATGTVTGASIEVTGVEGNVMAFRYAGMEVKESLMFAAFNPVILLSLLVSTPRAGWRILSVGAWGLALLLLAQVVTLRLLLAIDTRTVMFAGTPVTGYRATPGLELLEIVALASICVNWILPVLIWIAWVPTGFLARALKSGPASP